MLFLALHTAGDDAGPLLARSKAFPGPDGNVAIEGVLRKRFCFAAPSTICVPARSTVFYTVQRGGPHAAPPADARPPVPVLRSVDAAAPFEAYGLTFAAHRPTPPRPDQDASERRYSLEVFGDQAKGVLAKEFTLAGVVIGRGAVEFYVDAEGVLTGVALGILGADAQAGPFAIPKGSAVSVCPDGLQHARAPRASTPGSRAIVGSEGRHDEIFATREGVLPNAVAQVPWDCAHKRLGWTTSSQGQVAIPAGP